MSTSRIPGFLLIEMLAALLIAMLFFSILFSWQGVIIQARIEALARLRSMSFVRTLCEKVTSGGTDTEKPYVDQEGMTVAWHREQVVVPELAHYLPFVEQPLTAFRLITVEVTWKNACGIQRKTSIITAGGL